MGDDPNKNALVPINRGRTQIEKTGPKKLERNKSNKLKKAKPKKITKRGDRLKDQTSLVKAKDINVNLILTDESKPVLHHKVSPSSNNVKNTEHSVIVITLNTLLLLLCTALFGEKAIIFLYEKYGYMIDKGFVYAIISILGVSLIARLLIKRI